MLNREFENKVQQKMDELKLQPADDVWEKVEAALPEERKRRYWFFFLVFAGFIIAASLLLWKPWINSEKSLIKSNGGQEMAAAKTAIASTNTTANTNKNEITNTETGSLATNKLGSSNISTTVSDINSTIVSVPGKTKFKLANSRAVALNENNNNEDLANRKKVKDKTANRSKITINASLPDADNEKVDSSIVIKDVNINTETLPIDTSIVALTGNEKNKEKNKKDSLSEKITDTTKQVAINKSKKKQQHFKWNYGITGGAGISNVSTGLFKAEPVFADVMINAPGGPIGTPFIVNPSKPVSSLTFSIGVYIDRQLSAKWKFITGLNYAYQSNKIYVGNQVDSSVNFSVNNNGLSSDQFYRSGSSQKYKNKFHLLQLPLLFQYKLSIKLPVYVEAGPVLSYLIHSNALLYSSSSTYLTDNNAFNKLILSFNAGAGIDILKNKKFPFSLGYRFTYSLGSATKTAFGKQHLISSLLYVNVPLKK